MSHFFDKKNILIVESGNSIGTLFEQAFSDVQFLLKHYTSGKSVLKNMNQIQPDMILCNSETNDIQGREIFTTIAKSHSMIHFRKIPFVLFNNQNEKRLFSNDLFSLGLAGWFTESFESDEFREVLENIYLKHEIILKNTELQQEVKRSEYRYRDLLENANDFIFTLDDNGFFVYLNNRFSPLTGWEKEKWLGKPFLSIIDTEYRNKVEDSYSLAHQGKARLFEAKILGKTPDSPILSFNITPIFEKGQIVGSMGIARDVTDQKKMEREILDLKNFNESIIQSMEAGLLTVDLEGKITSLNEGGERILGCKTKEVLARKLNTILKPEEAEILLSKPKQPGSLSYSRETALTTKAGKKISIGFTATDRIDNQNKKVGNIISFRDITLLKQMQSEVIRMDRLASLGILASGIAHEIKNPLAGIKTLAQTCIEEFEETDPRIEYLTRIVRQVNRLDDLLKTVFAFARPRPPDRKFHKIIDILQEVINLLSKKMKNSGVQYIEKIEPELPEILVDAQQIQQVFLNLILNSVEAMPDGGTITFEAHQVASEELNSNRKQAKTEPLNHNSGVEIIISDTGTGIEPDKLEVIFDPFFTTKSSGLGLGLSIVYRIVEEHQGDIHVISKTGKGTSFNILLPQGATE